MPKTNEQLNIARHSFAHVMAAAVSALWPTARFGVGPVIDSGFYYDIEIPGYQLKEEDLAKIEKEMKRTIKAREKFVRDEMSIDAALKKFEELDQPYKTELLNDLKTKGTTRMDESEAEVMPDGGAAVSLYRTGEFLDLCRGPHVSHAGELEAYAFSLHRIAGAYWRGNEKNPMLTRIYGLAFASQKELEDYKAFLEKAEKRDHKKLGKELDLFTFSPLVGQGLPLFTPKGTLIRETLERFVESLCKQNGYQKVWIPHIAKPELYHTSGHWDKFHNDLFHIKGKSGRFVIKPMNCPHHTQIYASQPRSYKDLPVRFFETTTVYRDEQSGELGGLTRVRCITQDDGHSFLRPNQIEEEFDTLLTIQNKVLDAVGLDDYWISLSLRDPGNKEAYLGSDETWEKAQDIMRKILTKRKITFKEREGEAAFYGPKMDLMVKDSLGREWQISTIQLDFNMPKRFGLEYVDEKGNKQTPVMVHRAFMGSTERFIGLLIEHFAGALPVWLSPVQISIISVGKNHRAHCEKLGAEFRENGLRVEIDNANETVGNKIRKAVKHKIPYMLVIGDKEINSGKLAVRVRGQKKLLEIAKEEFIKKIKKEIAQKK